MFVFESAICYAHDLTACYYASIVADQNVSTFTTENFYVYCMRGVKHSEILLAM